MILNEMAKAFAFDYIADDMMISDKIRKTEMLIEDERKLDPELETIYSKMKNSDGDIIKEAEKLGLKYVAE